MLILKIYKLFPSIIIPRWIHQLNAQSEDFNKSLRAVLIKIYMLKLKPMRNLNKIKILSAKKITHNGLGDEEIKSPQKSKTYAEIMEIPLVDLTKECEY